MNPIQIIEKYYNKESEAYKVLIDHGTLVMNKAVEIAEKNKHLNCDIEFVKNGSLLHDIGIFLVWAPRIGCFGELPYICHGYLGREILEKEGFLNYGLVCERHISMGLTAEEIKTKEISIPQRDMIPLTLEEEIICLADKFFSKTSKKEEGIDKIKKELESYGWDHVKRFEKLMNKLNYS